MESTTLEMDEKAGSAAIFAARNLFERSTLNGSGWKSRKQFWVLLYAFHA